MVAVAIAALCALTSGRQDDENDLDTIYNDIKPCRHSVAYRCRCLPRVVQCTTTFSFTILNLNPTKRTLRMPTIIKHIKNTESKYKSTTPAAIVFGPS